jgi:hypothetical protein
MQVRLQQAQDALDKLTTTGQSNHARLWHQASPTGQLRATVQRRVETPSPDAIGSGDSDPDATSSGDTGPGATGPDDTSQHEPSPEQASAEELAEVQLSKEDSERLAKACGYGCMRIAWDATDIAPKLQITRDHRFVGDCHLRGVFPQLPFEKAAHTCCCSMSSRAS